jgi:hypothetical protein
MKPALAAVAAGAALIAACGHRSPDLFVIERTGSVPGARLTLRVSDGGIVHCRPGGSHRLADRELLAARALARDLEPLAARRVSLPPAPRSVLSYRVRLEAGVVSFSDNSPGLRPAMGRVQAFTHSVASTACRR